MPGLVLYNGLSDLEKIGDSERKVLGVIGSALLEKQRLTKYCLPYFNNNEAEANGFVDEYFNIINRMSNVRIQMQELESIQK